ncbi:MAG: AMP-binding protein, partial [Nocardioidaceae bacterium]
MESYAAGETSPALIEETIGANLERIVREHGEREAMVEIATGRRWTYAEFDRDVDALARGLMGAGIAKGDRVGIWAPNC